MDVNNIDAFQGQEREVIILNTVRSNSVDRIGFLDDDRRVNVSLTRAKRALFILGSASSFTVVARTADGAHYCRICQLSRRYSMCGCRATS